MSNTESDFRKSSLPGDTQSFPASTRYRRELHPQSAAAPPAVLCDFDETMVVENVAELLLEHFSHDGTWEGLKQQARDGTITFKDYQERSFRSIIASREEMKSVVKAKATLRPFFKDLWRYCTSENIPLAIVTVGLDFYVEAVLEREGLTDVSRYAVKTSFSALGISYEYPHSWDESAAWNRDGCRGWSTCKCSVLGNHWKMGHSIFYVGDGRSDFCPSLLADRVFAQGLLAQYCREHHISYSEFRDFRDVIKALQDSNEHNRQVMSRHGTVGGEG